MYGQGISREGNLLDVATEYNIVSRSGTWYSYGDVRLGQGRENAKQFLQENPDVADEMENQVRRGGWIDASTKRRQRNRRWPADS